MYGLLEFAKMRNVVSRTIIDLIHHISRKIYPIFLNQLLSPALIVVKTDYDIQCYTSFADLYLLSTGDRHDSGRDRGQTRTACGSRILTQQIANINDINRTDAITNLNGGNASSLIIHLKSNEI